MTSNLRTIEHIDTDDLFTRYLEIVNTAVTQHSDDTPYKRLIEKADDRLGDRPIGVCIYAGIPEVPHKYATLQVEDGELDLIQIGKQYPRTIWRLRKKHMAAVVDAPDEFADDPDRLDLNWLKTQFAWN